MKLRNLFKKKLIPGNKINPKVKEAPLDIQLMIAEKELASIKAEEDPARYISKFNRIKELKNLIANR